METFEIKSYLKQVKTFFDNNPNELEKLIGPLSKKVFYAKIEELAKINYNTDGDAALSRPQMIKVVVDMIDKMFVDTKLGRICLN